MNLFKNPKHRQRVGRHQRTTAKPKHEAGGEKKEKDGKHNTLAFENIINSIHSIHNYLENKGILKYKRVILPAFAIIIMVVLAVIFARCGLTTSTNNEADSTSTSLSDTDKAFINGVENPSTSESEEEAESSEEESESLYLDELTTVRSIRKLSKTTPRTTCLIYRNELTEVEMDQWGITSEDLDLPTELLGMEILGDNLGNVNEVIHISVSSDGTEGCIWDKDQLITLKDPKVWKDASGNFVVLGVSTSNEGFSDRELLYVTLNSKYIVEVYSMGNIDLLTLSLSDDEYSIVKITDSETWIKTTDSVVIYCNGQDLSSAQLKDGESFAEDTTFANGFFFSQEGTIYSIRSYSDENGTPHVAIFSEGNGSVIKFQYWIQATIGAENLKIPVYEEEGETYVLVPRTKSEAFYFNLDTNVASSDETQKFNSCTVVDYEADVSISSISFSLVNSKWQESLFYKIQVCDDLSKDDEIYEAVGYRDRWLTLDCESLISLIPSEYWTQFEDSINFEDRVNVESAIQQVIYDYAEANKETVISYLRQQTNLTEAETNLLKSLQSTQKTQK